jgi:amino acid transporter
MLSSSSQLAAFARDGGMPFPDLFSRVNPRTNTPIAGTIVLTAGTMLVLLFGLSPTAGPIIYSLAVICGLMMNAIPMCLRVYAGRSFVEGPFNYGRWSLPVHIFALSTIVWLVIMESFPVSPNWTPSTFNYNWAVALGVTLLATLAWFLHGSRAYKGPDLEAIEKFRMRRRGDAHSTISSDRIQVTTETDESGKPHIDSRS